MEWEEVKMTPGQAQEWVRKLGRWPKHEWLWSVGMRVVVVSSEVD